MDISLGQVIEMALKFGSVGLICIVWYFDRRDMTKMIEDHRKETTAILDKYNADVKETREMYKNNVTLVKSYQSIAEDLHSVVILNVQKLTEMKDSILQNQFCPVLRITKEKIEVNRT
jgi:ethanolamine ammonia-lyase large subunit